MAVTKSCNVFFYQQGLAIGVGMALGLKHKKNPAFVYNSMSDGELDEGSNWEAILFAPQHQLDNLVVMVDYNQALTRDEALARGRALDRAGVAWIEEPIRHDDYEGCAQLSAALDKALKRAEPFGRALDGQRHAAPQNAG